MSHNPYPQAAIRLNGELGAILAPSAEKSNYSAATKEFMEYGATVLLAGRDELSGRLSVDEWHALAAIFQGTRLEPSLLPYLHAEIADADTEIYDDLPALAGKVKALSFGGKWALMNMLSVLGINLGPEMLEQNGIKCA